MAPVRLILSTALNGSRLSRNMPATLPIVDEVRRQENRHRGMVSQNVLFHQEIMDRCGLPRQTSSMVSRYRIPGVTGTILGCSRPLYDSRAHMFSRAKGTFTLIVPRTNSACCTSTASPQPSLESARSTRRISFCARRPHHPSSMMDQKRQSRRRRIDHPAAP